MILRRLYLYLVSAAGLVLLAGGLAQLGRTVLLFVFNDPSAQYSRPALAGFAAMTLVALPVWGIHYWFARRSALRDPAERSAWIRRLYVYWACLVTALAAVNVASLTLSTLLRAPLDGQPLDRLQASQGAWALAVLLAFWAFHYRVAASDRAAAGEQGAAATLRRWYTYAALLAGLLTMLAGLSGVLHVGWLKVLGRPLQQLPVDPFLGNPAGQMLAGLALWGFHARMVGTGSIQEDDRRSTLRALEGFAAVFIAVVLALAGASQILYYAVARGLGIDNPGGAGSDVLAGVAGPASQLLVYGLTWFLVRRRLARDAAVEEAARQAGVRRLYTNLVALLSLVALSVGLGGLLWTLLAQLESPLIGVAAPPWKDAVSLWVTLLAVGVAVWLASWRPAPAAPERQSLSRRLYVYAALLASVLVILGSGVGLLNAVFRQAFSAHPVLGDPANLDFGHYLAVLVVAAAVGAYHWQMLRRDAAVRLPRIRPAPTSAPAAPAAAARRYELELRGAGEAELRRALDGLPAGAAYTLREVGPPAPEPAAPIAPTAEPG